MPLFKTELERRITKKFEQTETKMKNSFAFIRQDIKDIQKSVEAMRKYLKNQAKQHDYARRQDNKIRKEFREDVDEFTQKIKQLSLALARVNELEKDLITKKDLARIEDDIKRNFKAEVEEVKFRLKDFERSQKQIFKVMRGFEKRMGKLEGRG